VGTNSVLLSDTSIDCNSPTHKSWQTVSVMFIILWAIGIPVFFLYRLCSYHELWTYIPNVDNYDADKVRRKADVQLTIGFMTRGFRSDTYYWNSIKMYEKILLVILAVFFPGKVQLQVTSALIISVIFLLLQVKLEPMNSAILNMIEFIALLSSCILFSFGLFFFIPECSNDSTCKQGISLLIAVSILIFLAFCLWAFVNQIKVKCKEETEKERRKSVIEVRRKSVHQHDLQSGQGMQTRNQTQSQTNGTVSKTESKISMARQVRTVKSHTPSRRPLPRAQIEKIQVEEVDQ
jgi:hypothetical protein